MIFFVVPTGTDAPCYHLPFATGGMIAFNVLVLVLQYTVPGFEDMFVLRFNTINPITWVTHSCMHAGIGHLFGNMIAFTFCGWIIEGKVGWWRFIAIYFILAFISGGIVQLGILPFGMEGGALGASGVIYGMIAMVMIWAPENEVTLFVFALILFYPVTGTFSISILILSFALIAMEFLSAAMSGFHISSAMLHLIGAIPGAVIGYEMVRRRWVDCEGYDLLSIQSGKRGKRVITVQEEQERKVERQKAAEQALEALQTSSDMVDNYVAKGHFEMAINRWQMHRRNDRRFQLTEPQMVAIVNGLWHNESKREKVIPVIEAYVEVYHKLRVPMYLRLARYFLVDKEQPKKSLTMIKAISNEPLSGEQTQFAKRLVERARKMIQSGVIEFSD